jgi:putative flavoprotein involved in K+ transport
VSVATLSVTGTANHQSTEPVNTTARASAPATELLEVLVIGAGQAGLAVGYHLRSSGIRFALLDRHMRAGDSWRERHDSLTLFTPRSYSALAGVDFPGDPNGFPTKDQVADYLETFASHFELPVRWGVEVRTLERVDGLFLATLGDGTTVQARVVVIATGAFQVPSIPALADGFSSGIEQLPATEYRNPKSMREGTVLVVGDGAMAVR